MTKTNGLRGLDSLFDAKKRGMADDHSPPAAPPIGGRRVLFGTLEELRAHGRGAPAPAIEICGLQRESAGISATDLYRVVGFDVRPEDGGHLCSASLYRAGETLRVCWIAATPPSKIRGSRSVASVRGPIETAAATGDEIRIRHLAILERPEPSANLFDLVPDDWVKDHDLVEKARALIAALPENERWLFNAIFWDADRFWRFCTGPSSMYGHHAERCGNLRHCVEVAMHMKREFTDRQADTDAIGRAVLLGLLHDAGKADEYRLGTGGRHVMSDRGRLVGHRQTIAQWIAVAIAQWRIPIGERQVLAMLNALIGVSGAPDWMGLPRPATLEARLLPMADRWSGQSDLIARQSAETGWGTPHRHLGGAPYSP